MTQSALDADRCQLSRRIKESGESDNRIELQQCKRCCRTVQVNVSSTNSLQKLVGYGIDIHFQAEPQCRLRAESGAHAPETHAGNCLMQHELASPERLIAKCVEPKNAAALIDHSVRIYLNEVPAIPAIFLLPVHNQRPDQ